MDHFDSRRARSYCLRFFHKKRNAKTLSRLTLSLCHIFCSRWTRQSFVRPGGCISPSCSSCHFVWSLLKYTVSLNDVSETATIELDESQTNCPLVFVEPVRERTKKDKLFNDIVSYFVSASVSFESSELSMGRRLVVLRDILWHIDGHHHIFQQRAQPTFHSFINYNNPQLSKHHKRLTSNMSSDVLRDFALELSTVLHFSFWDRPHWLELKPVFLSLLQSISSYVEYLITKKQES